MVSSPTFILSAKFAFEEFSLLFVFPFLSTEVLSVLIRGIILFSPIGRHCYRVL